MKIIAVTGPESSGKTSFAQYATTKLPGALFIEEHARTFLEKNYPDGNFPKSAIEVMLLEQLEIWENALSQNIDYLILDGDITIYKIWIDVVYGENWKAIEDFSKKFHPDITVLCKPDIPWVADPLRSNPDDREYLFSLYKKELEFLKRPYVILEGSVETRNNKTFELVSRASAINDFK